MILRSWTLLLLSHPRLATKTSIAGRLGWSRIETRKRFAFTTWFDKMVRWAFLRTGHFRSIKTLLGRMPKIERKGTETMWTSDRFEICRPQIGSPRIWTVLPNSLIACEHFLGVYALSRLYRMGAGGRARGWNWAIPEPYFFRGIVCLLDFFVCDRNSFWHRIRSRSWTYEVPLLIDTSLASSLASVGRIEGKPEITNENDSD